MLKSTSLKLIALLAILLVLIGYAIYDFRRTLQSKSEEAQEAQLRGELSQFILGTREDDGVPLLEDPDQFAVSDRPLRILTLRRPFFEYFLNQGNAKWFATNTLNWDPPRSCQTEFPTRLSASDAHGSIVSVCVAAVPGDASGRYIYLSIVYPIDSVVVHHNGIFKEAVDHITFTFGPARSLTTVDLVFGEPTLATSRFPSQRERFRGLYEVSGYVNGDYRQGSKAIGGQAFLHTALGGADSPGPSLITVLARIDAAQIFPDVGAAPTWPLPSFADTAIGFSIQHVDDSTGQVRPIATSPSNAFGKAIISLEQLYNVDILSKSKLTFEFRPTSNPSRHLLWSSGALGQSDRLGSGLVQSLSDKLARLIVGSGRPSNVKLIQPFQNRGTVEASLQGEPILIPAVAARSLFWLTGAFLLVMVLGVTLTYALFRMNRITKVVYGMNRYPENAASLRAEEVRKGELGRLARAIRILFTNRQHRAARLEVRNSREAQDRLHKLELAQEDIRSKQRILDVIGHEIGSPLQTLLNMHLNVPEAMPVLERIHRAVDKLRMATTYQSGVERSTSSTVNDLLEYTSTYCANLRSRGKTVQVAAGVPIAYALFDPIYLQEVLDNLVDNAERFRTIGTPIELRLSVAAEQVTLEVSNDGPTIPEFELSTIFEFGASSHSTPENKGIGLYVCRTCITAMHGTIRVENRAGGPSFIIALRSDYPTTADGTQPSMQTLGNLT